MRPQYLNERGGRLNEFASRHAKLDVRTPNLSRVHLCTSAADLQIQAKSPALWPVAETASTPAAAPPVSPDISSAGSPDAALLTKLRPAT